MIESFSSETDRLRQEVAAFTISDKARQEAYRTFRANQRRLSFITGEVFFVVCQHDMSLNDDDLDFIDAHGVCREVKSISVAGLDFSLGDRSHLVITHKVGDVRLALQLERGTCTTFVIDDKERGSKTRITVRVTLISSMAAAEADAEAMKPEWRKRRRSP